MRPRNFACTIASRTFALFMGIAFLIANPLVFADSPPLAAISQERVPNLATTQAALEGLSKLIGFEADDSLQKIVVDFYSLARSETLDQAMKADLLEQRNIALWPGAIDEFVDLAILIDQDSAEQAQHQPEFAAFTATLRAFARAIKDYVLAIHPGFAALDITKLSARFTGQSVTIAVFDIFDEESLERQREAFPSAIIEVPVQFGRPLSLNHGNVVVDTILRIAPGARIVPVWADAKDYTKALQYIVDRPDIDIVNMSRAFAEAADHKHIEPEFMRLLKLLVKNRVLCKALGNTGTDLHQQVTPKRAALGLGPVNNLASYDTTLIADTYADGAEDDLLVFAINLSLFADDIALSATIPGDLASIQSRTLGVPAEGVWSPTTAGFESGSSFAAPQIAALIALLLEDARAHNRDPLTQKQSVLAALKFSAQRRGHGAEEWGLGLPSGDRAAGF